jgi:hypothetical protein
MSNRFLIHFFFLGLLSLGESFALDQKVKYKTRFENCPSQVLGRLTLKLIKYFEKNRSLFAIKKKIIDEKLAEIYYLEDYKIKFNPINNRLHFYFKCPVPSFKLDFIKNGQPNNESGILAENGVILSTGYLSLLRTEGKFLKDLPVVTIVEGDLENDVKLASQAGRLFKQRFPSELSELVLDENRHLTAILAVQNSPISVFMGADDWEEKMVKLKKTITYLDKRTRLPKVINLTDVKKVVVKFSDNN